MSLMIIPMAKGDFETVQTELCKIG